ncbi:hypothetical protein BVG79_00242 [Ketogulonicigenium robustum]|uniref:Uncharacterized protein n=1 Tax=Ketogulonicigenium robustum TaxID=92947 RepID=A0A1W6NWK3_9RHOB|nr:hypothetical protein BVG79_00242 [Ketogulonicigenium robustum]
MGRCVILWANQGVRRSRHLSRRILAYLLWQEKMTSFQPWQGQRNDSAALN